LEPETPVTLSGQLYIDASKWDEWHYINLVDVAAHTLEDENFNPSSLWQTIAIPLADGSVDAPASSDAPDFEPGADEKVAGIYTYWYDVFGEGLSNNRFHEYTPLPEQEAPDEWTIAIHRNNVRTNGGFVAPTQYRSLDALPEGREWLAGLEYTPDTWNERDVWTVQGKMLLGYIGNQGIKVNETLSSWLKVELPPIPPRFILDSRVFILRLADGSYAALQLENYQSTTGTKCCLTINYRYPL